MGPRRLHLEWDLQQHTQWKVQRGHVVGEQFHRDRMDLDDLAPDHPSVDTTTYELAAHPELRP